MNLRRLLGACAAITVAVSIAAVLALRPDAAARDTGPQLVAAPTTPAAWVRGSLEGTRLGLLSLRRSGPRVVTAKLRLTADRSIAGGSVRAVDLDALADDVLADDVSGARLIDEVHGRVIAPLRDADGGCVCSDVEGELRPGGSLDLYAKFLVPAGVDRVGLELPTFAPFDGVVIAPR